jgi:Holliday junction resolvase RusA-like endonuclease
MYTPKETVNAEAWVKVCALKAMGLQKPFKGPLTAIIIVHVAIPKSYTRKQREAIAAGDLYPTGKPDLDNIAKLFADAMNGIVYVDDKQIVDLIVNKVYGEHAETLIMIKAKGKSDGRHGIADGAVEN